MTAFDLDEELDIRYSLCTGRIEEILREPETEDRFKDFFRKCCEKCLFVKEVTDLVISGEYRKLPLEELQLINKKQFEDIMPDSYKESLANHQFAVDTYGEYGNLFAFLYMKLCESVRLSIMGRFYESIINLELFNEIYNVFVYDDELTPEKIKKIIYDHIFDYLYDKNEISIKLSLTAKDSFVNDIVTEADLSDPRYLYYYGEYVGPNEISISKYLNSLHAETIDKMSGTFVRGYVDGFKIQGIDLSKKGIVQIRYNVGFERVIRRGVELFKKCGLKASYIVSSSDYNPQLKYDHSQDDALFADKPLYGKMLDAAGRAMEIFKDDLKLMAGPAVMECFGEKPFEPIKFPAVPKLDERQQRLNVEFTGNKAMLTNKYINPLERSFTIIAFPIPEIGDDFEAIFNEVINVNTLDNEKYKKIQQSIVDALDKAEYVHVKGAGANKTDLRISLYKLNDPSKETKFENCTADVNIPVGEVFTSPVLKGTDGILNVSKVYLNGLNYKDLTLTFKDGKIADYNCSNFEDPKEGKRLLKDNVLMNNPTLPMGEFAIGTNTTAYVMANKYNIQDRLPILIMEKTGPHFAVGDTCYSRSEDNPVYNPDGKEIVARENEISALRKEEPQKAYFNCHTDITIPYDELDTIIAYPLEGAPIEIIRNGRFCLPGTEELNSVF